MKANELMIGDWVLLKSLISDEVFIERVLDAWGLSQIEEHGELFIPIPLTAEILEKNGFVYDRNERYVNWDIDLAVRKDDVYFILWDRVTLHYVHELQHALRLCGLDELADNFKL